MILYFLKTKPLLGEMPLLSTRLVAGTVQHEKETFPKIVAVLISHVIDWSFDAF